MRKLWSPLVTLIAAFWLMACASQPSSSTKPSSSASLIDVLTLFAESVQGDRFENAMTYLSLSERARFEAAGGPQSPYIQRQLKALRLSTLARRPTVKQDPRGLLEGIYEQLPELPYTSEPPSDSTKSVAPGGSNKVSGPATTDTSTTVDKPLPDLP